MRDTLDLVPIGAYYGHGKRTGIFGAYILAAFNREYKNFEAICKIGTGFKDADLKRLHETLQPYLMKEKPSIYHLSPTIKPDFWITPKFIWEIGADQFSQSLVYRIGKGRIPVIRDEVIAPGADVGLSLRFPRFIREREDKYINFSLVKNGHNSGEI